MRVLLIFSVALVTVSETCVGQSDLEKIGRFLQGIQDMQQQNQPDYNQGGNTPRSAPYNSGNPNASGNQNQGNFNNGNNFFGPQNGMQPGGNTYPNNGHPNHFQNGNYPNNNTYPNGTYQGQGQPIYRNGQVIYPQGSTVPGNRRTVYSDPPTAPPRTYSRLPIVIRCSPDAVGTCDYELVSGSGTGFPYQMKAGQTQNLSETTDWAIRYRPTPSSPPQTYRLRGGKTYELRNNGNSWQCYMAP